MGFGRGVRTALVAALALIACDDGDAGPSEPALSAATYNLGLLESVPYASQRAPRAIEAASALDADLLCVQEVWEQPHWDALVAAQAGKRPHALRIPADPGAMGQCSVDQFTPLQQCAQNACAQSDTLVSCVTMNCPTEVGALATGCTACLLENASSGDFGAIRSACVGNATAGAAGRSYVSGGSYGIGLLSRRPFAATEQRVLDSSTVRRGILYARVEDPALGSVHVFCTHLAAILSGFTYDGSYGDWDGENAAHVDALIAFVQERAGADGKVLVLGDLNTSPAASGISPSVPANYAKFMPAGFTAPYLRGSSPACTFCADNPLVMGMDPGSGALLDHVLTRAIPQRVTVTRELDDLVELDVPQADGSTAKKRLPLSDHYALRAVVAR